MFTVIIGGKTSLPTADEVRAEGERRIAATGHAGFVVRERATGQRVPDEVRYLPMQIRFAADAISELTPIPADYKDDRYWPCRPTLKTASS